MRLRNLAIALLLLAAAALAALIAVNIHFSNEITRAVGERAALSSDVSRHADAVTLLSLFSFAALAAGGALAVAAAAQKKPVVDAPCIHGENLKKLSNAYRESLIRCQCLIDVTPAAIIETDSSGNIASLNDNAQKLAADYADSLSPGMPLAHLLPRENRDELDGLLDKIRRGDTVKKRELAFVRGNGMPARLEISGAPIWSNGTISGFFVSIHDPGAAGRLATELEDARRAAAETSEQLKKTTRDFEEFALLAIKREGKMQEIRERLKSSREERGDKQGLMH